MSGTAGHAAGWDKAMWTRRLGWMEPIEAAAKLADLPGLAVLDSAMRHETLGRYSYVCVDPFSRFVVDSDGTPCWAGKVEPGAPLEALRERLQKYTIVPRAGLPPFQGGAIGGGELRVRLGTGRPRALSAAHNRRPSSRLLRCRDRL